MITLTPESTPLRWLIVPTTLIAGALILSGCDSEPQRAIANDYQVFTQPAAEDDAPASEEVENIVSELEIEDEDLRGVGHHDGAEFYAAISHTSQASPDADGQSQYLCFIVADNDADIADSTCASPAEYNDQPTVALQAGDSDTTIEAFLVPDGTTFDTADGWLRASPNVVVIPDQQNADDELNGHMGTNEDITLQRISQ